MANPPRIRKRINAFLRAPDGSAFNKCEHCGVSFPIALSDMHECEGTRNAEKKRRVGSGEDGFCSDGKTRIVDDQPRSAFCFFMESCRKNYENENWIEIDRKGFQLWKELSSKGRLPFELKADRVNSAYQKVLLDEVDDKSEVDDEADSSMVGKHYPDYLDPNYMDRVLWPCNKLSSFDSDDWYQCLSLSLCHLFLCSKQSSQGAKVLTLSLALKHCKSCLLEFIVELIIKLKFFTDLYYT